MEVGGGGGRGEESVSQRVFYVFRYSGIAHSAAHRQIGNGSELAVAHVGSGPAQSAPPPQK
jgi:hypothetical protein